MRRTWLPKALYRVVVTGGKREHQYLAPGGKTYARLDEAEKHVLRIARNGQTAEIYYCEPIWHPLKDAPQETIKEHHE